MSPAHACIMKEEKQEAKTVPPGGAESGYALLLHRLAIMKHLVDATRVCKESALVWNLSRLHSIASV